MKKRRKLSLFVALLIMCITFNVPTYARTPDTATPWYTIARTAVSELTINGTSADCKSNVYSGTAVKITVEQTLQKSSASGWGNVRNAYWTTTVNVKATTVANTKTGLSNGTYRLKSVFKLTNASNDTETITVYSSEKTI